MALHRFPTSTLHAEAPLRKALPVLFLLIAGCAGWHREEISPATPIPARKQVIVYHGAAHERWHGTTVTADSISGIHYLRPIECDSCRVALPLTAVDSIRVGDPSLGVWKGAALVTLGPLVALSLICVLFGENPACFVPPST